MSKKNYKKKTQSFKSFKELEKAKKEIKDEYSNLGNEAIETFFNPIKMVVDWAPNVLGLFRKSKKSKKAKINRHTAIDTDQKVVKEINILPIVTAKKESCIASLNIIDPLKSKGLGNKVLSSFIRWQLFEISLWTVKKIVSAQKKKIKKHKEALETL
ncbi:MAG TPA: hypothetical protein VLZ83_14520 [Edaphocola sp.]|nr:hypothetical protein [Edaphocola sp.]